MPRLSESNRVPTFDIVVPDPPCDWFGGCEHRERCKREKLACDAFLGYSTKPNANARVRSRARNRVNPSREIYLKAVEEK